MIKRTMLLILASSLLSAHARAETIFGVTVFRDLISFDSATPGTTLGSTPITGLVGQAAFESVVAIDFRPATQQLYALGNAPGNIYRIYTLNPATAVATQVGADITIFSGNFVGFDFNPVVDLIRIVTEADQNHRFNATTGALVNTDPALAYLAGDANQAANPNVVGAAYNNNVAGAAATTLFDIDSTLDVLTTQNPANNGSLTTVGALGANFPDYVGFDISGGSGVAYASTADPGSQTSQLYMINLSSGAATLVGAIGSMLAINDIAVMAVPVPEVSSLALLSIGAALIASGRRPRHTSRKV